MRAAALALATVVAAAPATAVETRWAFETGARLSKGQPEGLAVSADGRLSLAPEITALGPPDGLSADAYGWDLGMRQSRVVIATGPEGRILEVDGETGPRVLARVEEPMVTAVASLPDGTLIAGTAPGGTIYRLARGGRVETWAETGERYVWALLVTPEGTVYAGTGERGRVLAMDERGRGELLFDSDEPHVVALALARDGSLLAAGAGRGLVYRIGRDGRAQVLYQDPLPEVRAIAQAEDGTLWVAALAPPPAEPRAPAVRIRVPPGEPALPGGAGAAETGERVLEGVIEGLGRGRGEVYPFRGHLVKMKPGREAREVWRSEEEAVYALSLDPEGRPCFGTGEPARLYCVRNADTVELVASWAQAQVTALRRQGRALLAATSNPAGLYRVGPRSRRSGRFEAAPMDAGAVATWGRVFWDLEGPGRVRFETRTGNSAQPDQTWSPWQPVGGPGPGALVASPPGRYLQWRVELEALEAGAPVRLSDVRVAYRPRNRAPRILGFELQGGRSAREVISVRWQIEEPDDDPLEIALEYCPRTSGDCGREALETTSATDTVEWKLDGIPEGRYDVRLVVSDATANTAEEAEEARSPWRPLVVDRTAPALAREGRFVAARDALSPIAWGEWIAEDGTRRRLDPEDGVADAPRERFALPGEPSSGRLRVADAAGNVAEWPP